MASIKLYISELKEYRESICCFLDLIANIILWRGKATLSFCGYQFSIWFPIHSIWLFTSAVLAFEKPKLAPPIFFFGIAWVMISLNYNYSRLPFPWDRVKRFEDLVLTLTFKRSPPASVRQVIEPFTAIEEKEQITALRKLKADRMAALLSAFVDTSLKALRIYSGTSITSKSRFSTFVDYRMTPRCFLPLLACGAPANFSFYPFFYAMYRYKGHDRRQSLAFSIRETPLPPHGAKS